MWTALTGSHYLLLSSLLIEFFPVLSVCLADSVVLWWHKLRHLGPGGPSYSWTGRVLAALSTLCQKASEFSDEQNLLQHRMFVQCCNAYSYPVRIHAELLLCEQQLVSSSCTSAQTQRSWIKGGINFCAVRWWTSLYTKYSTGLYHTSNLCWFKSVHQEKVLIMHVFSHQQALWSPTNTDLVLLMVQH